MIYLPYFSFGMSARCLPQRMIFPQLEESFRYLELLRSAERVPYDADIELWRYYQGALQDYNATIADELRSRFVAKHGKSVTYVEPAKTLPHVLDYNFPKWFGHPDATKYHQYKTQQTASNVYDSPIHGITPALGFGDYDENSFDPHDLGNYSCSYMVRSGKVVKL